jgi:hypothetical protein
MKMERARITEYAEYLQETLSNNSGKLLVGTGISEEQHIKSSERKTEFYTQEKMSSHISSNHGYPKQQL